jgi:hypothetical protein
MNMQKAAKVFARVWGVLGIAFVLFHTGSLIVGGINRLVAGPEYNIIDKVIDNFLTATGTIQRWNMFSPNVGDESSAPIVALTFKDGSRKLLHSPATPPMVREDLETFFVHNLSDEERAMEWITHVGDGRRRKLDSRIINCVSTPWAQRTTYARWMLQQYMDENPEKAGDIVRVDLYETEVIHNGGEPLPRRGQYVHYMFIYPESDPLWPKGIGTSIDAPPP